MTADWSTPEGLAAIKDALAATIEGWTPPVAYAVGISSASSSPELAFPHVNAPGGTHGLPAVVLAKLLGHAHGEPVRAYAAPSDLDEAAFIVDVVKGLVEDNVSPAEIAVLYRSNAQSRVVEHALFNAAMPYRVYGGMRFFERAEIKHALAYLRLIAASDDDGLHVLRHSTAHVMAQAVCALYPGAKVAIGPAIDDGFYYDFQLPKPLSSDDLPAIEERMRELIAADRLELISEKAIDSSVTTVVREMFQRFSFSFLRMKIRSASSAVSI